MPRICPTNSTNEHDDFLSTVVRSRAPVLTTAVSNRSLPRRTHSAGGDQKPAGSSRQVDAHPSTQIDALQHLLAPSHDLTQRSVFLAIAPPTLFVVVIIAILLALRTHLTEPPSVPPMLASMGDIHIKVETNSIIDTALIWAEDSWRRWAMVDGDVRLQRVLWTIASLCAAVLVFLRAAIWVVGSLIEIADGQPDNTRMLMKMDGVSDEVVDETKLLSGMFLM